jgi:HEAT repeat protein
VAIRASAAGRIATLVAGLSSDNATVREAAIAGLIVIGARAVDRVMAAAGPAAPATARVAALRALEGIGDRRAMDVALAAIDADAAGVSVAALGVLRRLLAGDRGAEALDAIAAVALDRRRASPVRVAAVRALLDLDDATVAPIRARIEEDPDPAIRSAVGASSATFRYRIDGPLPDDPVLVKREIAAHAQTAPLPALHRLIERLREREEQAPAAERAAWAAARAAVHAALASRGSLLALYDLRETLESASGPLPVEFLAALRTIGDSTCLEPLAAAYSRAVGREDDRWWSDQLRAAFATIVVREKITRRHAAMKKIEKRYPAIIRPA